MIQINVDGERIKLNEDSVLIDIYLIEELFSKDPKTNLKKVYTILFTGWLKSLDSEHRQFYLPYSIDDEFVETFRATKDGNLIVLKCVSLYVFSFDFKVEENFVYEFSLKNHEIAKEYPDNFGEYDIVEFKNALLNYINMANGN